MTDNQHADLKPADQSISRWSDKSFVWMLLVVSTLFVCPILARAQVKTAAIDYRSGEHFYRISPQNRALMGKPASREKSRVRSVKTASQRDTLALDPVLGFYDDFANSAATPDTTKWVKGSGVYINNTFTRLQPNFNVATFDGLRANGTPYDTARVGFAFTCDTLTSLPIDLFNLPNNQGDSLVLSFDYQIGGPAVQFMPELFDSLSLYFKLPRDTNWTKVWFTLGDTLPIAPAKAFKRVMIPLGFQWQEYGFQFRFINYGSRNGTGDIFNIDNVYLNYGREQRDSIGSRRFRDIAGVKAKPLLFSQYTSIPRFHLFQGSCQATLTDSLSAQYTNQNNYTAFAQEVPYSIRITVDDSASGRRLESVDDPRQITSEFPILGYFNFLRPFRVPEERVKVSLPTAGLDSLSAFVQRPDTGITTLLTTYSLPVPDAQNNPYRRNDTLITATRLHNYYAYDDGSAELVRWTGGNNARMAQEFDLCTRDSLRAIEILFPKTLQNTFPGRTISFNLFVWPRLLPVRNNQPDRFYTNLGVTIVPAQLRNGYTSIQLFRPVLIDTGKYYIGWQQGVGVESEVRVGVDMDTEPGYKIWYNVNGNWFNDTTDKHPFCIRPVFGPVKRQPVSLDEQLAGQQVKVWPNPVAGQRLMLSGRHDQVEVFNLMGQPVSTSIQKDDAETVIHFADRLPAGTYVIRYRSGHRAGQTRFVALP